MESTTENCIDAPTKGHHIIGYTNARIISMENCLKLNTHVASLEATMCNGFLECFIITMCGKFYDSKSTKKLTKSC